LPWWGTLLIAFCAALTGVLSQVGFEEWRDFRGARRVVAGELSRDAAALRAIEREEAGRVHLPTVISTEAYRQTRLILARYLPAALWTDLENVYDRLHALEHDLGGPTPEPDIDDLWRQADTVSQQLRRQRLLAGRRLRRRARG
jgi:hypothetical protein